MKKFLSFALMVIIAVGLISWGTIGHRTVAQIAANHLTPEAKRGIYVLLGNQSLADVSTWADEVRNEPTYKKTAPWHYLNLPLGLSYEQFVAAVKSQPNENIYTALLKCEKELADKNVSLDQKAIDLRFIVHLVGDLHQPMHISRAEDKGGNSIQVQFLGKGTNLHALWDSKLIEHEGLDYSQMAKDYDKASTAQINQWQHDDVLKWIYESYQTSSKLYTEVQSGSKLDEDYYNRQLPIVKQRIEIAGIRLAGLLNTLFKTTKLTKTLTQPAPADEPSVPPPPPAQVKH
jgi:hypothetical protein